MENRRYFLFETSLALFIHYAYLTKCKNGTPPTFLNKAFRFVCVFSLQEVSFSITWKNKTKSENFERPPKPHRIHVMPRKSDGFFSFKYFSVYLHIDQLTAYENKFCLHHPSKLMASCPINVI